MSFFNDVKKFFDGKDKVYDVTFTEEKLGMVLSKGERNTIIVKSTDFFGAAQKAGVKEGDKVMQIDGNTVTSYDDSIAILQALGRPLTMRFFHGDGVPNVLGSTNIGSSTTDYSNNNTTIGQSSQSSLTDEEKRARRQQLAEAATKRGEKWDRKVSTAKSKRLLSSQNSLTSEKLDNDFKANTSSAETRATVQLAKNYEEKLANQMGYNPFQAHISTNNEANSIAVRNPSPITTNVENGISSEGVTNNNNDNNSNEVIVEPIEITEDEEMKIDIAITELMQHDKKVIDPAIKTIYKMLNNLIGSPENEKFRKIRISNPNFQKKVASVNGTIDIMLSAGFILVAEDDESYLTYVSKDGKCNLLDVTKAVNMKLKEIVDVEFS